MTVREGFGFIKPVDDTGEDLYFRFTDLPYGCVLELHEAWGLGAGVAGCPSAKLPS